MLRLSEPRKHDDIYAERLVVGPRRPGEQHPSSVVPVRAGGLPGRCVPQQCTGLHVLGLVQQHPSGVQEVESGVLRLWGGCSSRAGSKSEQDVERDSPGLVPVRPGRVPGCRVPRQQSWLHVLGLVQQHASRAQELESRVLRLRGGYPRSAYTRCWQRYSERHSPGLVPVRPGGLPGCRLPRQRAWLHMLGLVQQHPFGVQEVESGVLRLRR